MSDESNSTQDLIGQTLGRYRIEEVLGSGGMAWVYRAWDQNLERDVAVKVIRPQALDMAQGMERFRREARAIAQLDHPHIIQVYDFGEVDDQPYMVMQYITGPNLEDRLREWCQQGRLLTRDEVLMILRQVAEALDYAHERGLIHRDVKPSNVLFKEPDHTVLTDFGVARLHHDLQGQHPTLTDADQVLGTPTYMAPEQATRTVPTSPASDVYSLAVMAYEMLSGQPPFEADSTLSAILQHILEPAPSICERRPELSPDMDLVLHRALDKDPEQRFPTATAFVRALEAAWEEQAPGSEAETIPEEAAPPASAPEDSTPAPEPEPEDTHSPQPPPAPEPEDTLPPQPAPTPLAAASADESTPEPPPAKKRSIAWGGLSMGIAIVGGGIAALVLVSLLVVVVAVWAGTSGILGNASPSPTITSSPPAPSAAPSPTGPPAPSPTSPATLPPSSSRSPATLVPSTVTVTVPLTYHAVYLGSRETGGTFIRGQVTDRDKRPVPNVYVELYSPEWKWLQTTGTGTDGRYEFIVSPNSYYLRLKNQPSVASSRITVKYSHEVIVNWEEGEP